MNSIIGHTGYIADVFLKKFYRAPTQNILLQSNDYKINFYFGMALNQP